MKVISEEDNIYIEELMDIIDEIPDIDEATDNLLKTMFDESGALNLQKFTEHIEELELLYTRRMYLTFKGAGIFDPLSDFGGQWLSVAQSVKDEYEMMGGILSTVITANNIDPFRSILTVDLCEDIIKGVKSAVGAVRRSADGLRAAGVIVFHLDTDLVDENTILHIDWLYVRSSFRGQGVATGLMGELIYKSTELDINLFTASFQGDENDPIYRILSDWGFVLESGYAPELYVRLADRDTDAYPAGNYQCRIEQISTLPEKYLRPIAVQIAGGEYQLQHRLPVDIMDDYYDRELSCCALKGKGQAALLLTHVSSDKDLHIAYMGCTDGAEDALEELLRYMTDVASAAYAPETRVVIRVESPEMGIFCDSFFTDQIRRPVMAGLLRKPDTMRNMDIERAAAVMAKYETEVIGGYN